MKKLELNNWIILLFLIIVSGAVIYFTDQIVIHILGLSILVFGVMFIVKFDFSHPFVWYSIIYWLYSISYPVLVLTSNSHDIHIYTKDLMILQWLALSVVLIVVGPKIIHYKNLKDTLKYTYESNLITKVLTILVLLTATQVSRGDFTHKSEIYQSGSLFIILGFRLVLVLIILFTINLVRYAIINNTINKKLTISVFSAVFAITFFSGERDFLLRVILSIFFVYYIIVNKQKKDLKLILIAFAALLSIPILSQFKYFGLTGEVNTSNTNFIISLLNSEFSSASKNLQILLLDESSRGLFRGSTLFNSLIRGVGLEFLLPNGFSSSVSWYNNRYFAAGRAGQGFTLIGDGYINFGEFGVILVFLFVGFIIKLIYRKSNQNAYYLSFYILSISIFMYSLRADLANVLSPLITQNLLGMVIIHYLMMLLHKVKKNNVSL